MVRLTLKQCAYFVAVVEKGGIAQAARALNISQPAVAQALDKLEAICGLRLLVRHHARGTELTPHGRAFCQSARDLLRQAERAEREALAIATGLAGTIRFGCFHTIAPFYMAQILKAYGARHPDVDIVATELLQDDIVSSIEAAELDLALTYDMSLDDRPLERRVVARLKPFVVLSCEHPLAARSSIRLSEMAREPFVMFDGPSSRDYFAKILDAHGIDPPVAFSSRSMESVRCAVANGLGFSLSVMRPSHAETYDGGRVVSVPIVGETDPIAIVLVRKRDRAPSNLVDKFADFCQAHVSHTKRQG